jgi:hypothetical protein
LTSLRKRSRIDPTAEYIVIPAPVPCSIAVFSCRCGAQAFEDTKHVAPEGWSTADDGTVRCPVCSEKK